MPRSSGQNRHVRRPALEQCEHRVLQSITVRPVGDMATQPQVTAHTSDASPIVAPNEITAAQRSRAFDDPFFFDVN